MPEVSRRGLLAVGGAAVLGGCMAGGTDDTNETTSDGTEPPTGGSNQTASEGRALADSTVELLETVPMRVDEDPLGYLEIYTERDRFDVDAERIDRFGRARYAGKNLFVLVGSFPASAPTALHDDGKSEPFREDGLFVESFLGSLYASDGEPWSAGIEAATADTGQFAADSDAIRRVLGAIPKRPVVTLRNGSSIDPEEGIEPPLYLVEAEATESDPEVTAALFEGPSDAEAALQAGLPDDATVRRRDGALAVFEQPPTERGEERTASGDDPPYTTDAQ